jgi:hypothetical protein
MKKMRLYLAPLLVGFLAGWVAGPLPGAAHEVESYRISVVLRDQNHVSITLYIVYLVAMFRALGTDVSFSEFILAHASMNQDDLGRDLSRAQALLEKELQLVLPKGQTVGFTNWKWPDPLKTQADMRQLVMAAMIPGGDHMHAAIAEVTAEAQTSVAITKVKLHLPAALLPSLLVFYRANQIWVDRNAPVQELRF